jgi:hypothetical protein
VGPEKLSDSPAVKTNTKKEYSQHDCRNDSVAGSVGIYLHVVMRNGQGVYEGYGEYQRVRYEM